MTKIVTQESTHTVIYKARLHIPRVSGILLPGPIIEDVQIQLAFDKFEGGKEAFIKRMEYMYDTMERAINERKNYLREHFSEPKNEVSE